MKRSDFFKSKFKTRDELVNALKDHVHRKDFDDYSTYARVLKVIEEVVLIVDEGSKLI